MQKLAISLALLMGATTTLAKAAHPSLEEMECNAILQASTIAQEGQPYYLIELESAGWIVRPGEKLEPLEIGFYIYLITSKGEILVAPKYDVQKFLKTGKGLATHKSLLQMYAELRGESAKGIIVGGGEFQVALGPVYDFSNRSGNFKNDKERMLMSASFLESKGLKIVDWTDLRAINPDDPEDRGHTPKDRNFDEFHLEFMSKVELSPRGRALRSAFTDLQKLVIETFPAATPQHSNELMATASLIGKKITKEGRGQIFIVDTLGQIYKRNGIDFGIYALLRDKSALARKESYGIPFQINNIMIGAGNALTPELKAKWMVLSLKFSSLPK